MANRVELVSLPEIQSMKANRLMPVLLIIALEWIP